MKKLKAVVFYIVVSPLIAWIAVAALFFIIIAFFADNLGIEDDRWTEFKLK